jgi:ureidoacrylate peracid hydrolase
MTTLGRIVTVQARPAPLTVGIKDMAVLVIDMQNDFGAPGGMFALAGIDVSGIGRAVAPTARVVAAARGAGVPIVYLKMAFRPDLSDAGGPESPHWLRHRQLNVGARVTDPNGAPSRILIDGTWNTEMLPELTPIAGDVVIRKHRYSGFYETDLDATLRRMCASTLIVTGCTTSICVESTIRDATFRDYSCVLLEDCTAQPEFAGAGFSTHDASVLTIASMFGSVSDSSAFVHAIS